MTGRGRWRHARRAGCEAAGANAPHDGAPRGRRFGTRCSSALEKRTRVRICSGLERGVPLRASARRPSTWAASQGAGGCARAIASGVTSRVEPLPPSKHFLKLISQLSAGNAFGQWQPLVDQESVVTVVYERGGLARSENRVGDLVSDSIELLINHVV